MAVENDPADAGSRGGASYLGQRRTAGGFEDDAVGKRCGFCLDELEDLLALADIADALRPARRKGRKR